MDDDLREALADPDLNVDAVCLTAALAVTGQDAPRNTAEVLALLELLPKRVDELPADIRDDRRSDVLHMVDRAALGRAARLAEQVLSRRGVGAA